MFGLSPYRTKIVIYAVIAALVLGGSAALYDRLHPQPVARTVHTETTETAHTQASGVTNEQLAQALSSVIQRQDTLQQQVHQQETKQSDLAQNITRETIRYVGQPPASATGPSVIVLPDQRTGSAANNAGLQVPAGPAGVPIEIVREIISSSDKSRTERIADATTAAQHSEVATTMETTQKDTHTETHTDTATTAKTVTDVSERPVAGSGGGSSNVLSSLGIGTTTSLNMFASYDLASMQLGPGRFTLGRLGAGLFIEAPLRDLTSGDFSRVDGGPQINFSPPKSHFFGMLGYGLREQKVGLGVGLRF
jgi:hypothetical protein